MARVTNGPAKLRRKKRLRKAERALNALGRVNPLALEEFAALEGCKVLMCHKPEDYFKHVRGHEIDLVVAGHAHGGQIRIGGRGLYAPGQGLFPKYTHGVIDERLIISAGASNPAKMPRWGNPCEILMITLEEGADVDE